MDTNSFISHIKSEIFYKDIADDAEKRFDTWNYEINRPLPTGKSENVIGLMKDELTGKNMKEFVALRPKRYSYLMDDGNGDKKARETKKCVIKGILKYNHYKKCLLYNWTIYRSKQRFKSETHNVYTEEINKIALSSHNDKILKSFGRIISYSQDTSIWKVCKTELLNAILWNI